MHGKFGHWMGLFAAALVLAQLGGCMNKTTTDKDISFVKPAEARELVDGKKKLLGLAGTAKGTWVDPRTAAEFNAERIPGAINVPYQVLSEEYKTLKAYDVVVVYGADYNDPVADGYSKSLIELGHSNVYTLLGGLRAWKADGNSVEGTSVKKEE